MAEIFLSHDVILTKTSEGLDELERRSRGVHARARRILILCNGERSLGEIVSLFGPSASALALELIEQGLLAAPVLSARHSPVVSSVERRERGENRTNPSGETGSNGGGREVTSSRSRRRSIALARMYMFDMVHRLLGDKEEPARAYLREARSPQALAEAFHECLLLIREISGDDMASKVASQLLEMVPEEMIEKRLLRLTLESCR
jgi:hypothetical protein